MEKDQKLVAWANQRDMDFNVNKCGVTHMGTGNLPTTKDHWMHQGCLIYYF